jgi:hypothetical protein
MSTATSPSKALVGCTSRELVSFSFFEAEGCSAEEANQMGNEWLSDSLLVRVVLYLAQPLGLKAPASEVLPRNAAVPATGL